MCYWYNNLWTEEQQNIKSSIIKNTNQIKKNQKPKFKYSKKNCIVKLKNYELKGRKYIKKNYKNSSIFKWK